MSKQDPDSIFRLKMVPNPQHCFLVVFLCFNLIIQVQVEYFKVQSWFYKEQHSAKITLVFFSCKVSCNSFLVNYLSTVIYLDHVNLTLLGPCQRTLLGPCQPHSNWSMSTIYSSWTTSTFGPCQLFSKSQKGHVKLSSQVRVNLAIFGPCYRSPLLGPNQLGPNYLQVRQDLGL